MKKRFFQILDDMNVTDTDKDTANVGICYDLVGLQNSSSGFQVTMGVPEDAGMKIMTGNYMPVLILVDLKEYEKIEAENNFAG